MVKKVSLTAKTMGISTPIIARGVNPHESIRQSALTLDGPAMNVALRSSDLVLVDAMPNGIPGFSALPQANEIETYASARGFENVNDLQKFVDAFAPRFGIVWFGSEWEEMNMLDDFVEVPLNDLTSDDPIECDFNNVVVMKDAYIKNVILPFVDRDFAGSVMEGGPLKLVKMADNKIYLTAAHNPDDPNPYGAGSQEVVIPGTTVIKAGTYTDNEGHTFTTIDFVC